MTSSLCWCLSQKRSVSALGMGPLLVSEAFLLFLLAVTARGDLLPDEGSCDPPVNITGGTVILSNGVAVGSVLRYICPPGFYPYPTGRRTCQSTGQWSVIRESRRRVFNTATCREFRCPVPSVEQGTYSPYRVSHAPGDTVGFACDDGYQLLGSSSRTCLSNGRWNGSTAVCEDGADTCPNPGTPPGSVKFGKNYGVGDKVRYRCQGELILIGSPERVCLESGEWSGSEPSCQHKHSFDLPEEVAKHFSSSFSQLLSESEVEQQKQVELGRTINLRQDQKLHIYALLDISGSISKSDFENATEALSKFIDMISRFEVGVKYGVLLFGSLTRTVVDPADEWSVESKEVANIVSKLKYDDYIIQRRMGTNVTGALRRVYEMMSFARAAMGGAKRSEWDEIRHVILIYTDGRANVGGSPAPMMNRIRSFLEIENSREDFLDVYVFGLGEDADKQEINSIASKKNNERHAFFLHKEDLTVVFNSMLDLSSVGNLCGFANKSLVETHQSSFPWFIDIFNDKTFTNPCSGSIVASQWILTAAHCFGKLEVENPSIVTVHLGGSDNVIVKAERVIVHPLYNQTRKAAEKIREFYDYDVALVKLATRLNFTTYIRPICLPCTHETSVALRKAQEGTSCSDHESELLPAAKTVEAKFIRTKDHQAVMETVKIKTGDLERTACERDALKADVYVNVSDVRDVVTDRFLCTGGNFEPISCKGDSGGPLYVKKLYRYIQVGIVSWGVKDVCMARRPPDYARDFHVNVFRVLDWLRAHLAESLSFLEPQPSAA